MSGSNRYHSRPGTSHANSSGSRYLNPDDVMVRGSGSLADREHKSFFARMSPAGRANFEQKYAGRSPGLQTARGEARSASMEGYRGPWSSGERKDPVIASATRRALLESSPGAWNHPESRIESSRIGRSSESSSHLRRLGLVEGSGANVSSQKARAGYDVWPDIRDADSGRNLIKRKPVPASMPRGASEGSYLRGMELTHPHRPRYGSSDSRGVATGRSRYFQPSEHRSLARDDSGSRLRHGAERHDAKIVEQTDCYPTGDRAARYFAL